MDDQKGKLPMFFLRRSLFFFDINDLSMYDMLPLGTLSLPVDKWLLTVLT